MARLAMYGKSEANVKQVLQDLSSGGTTLLECPASKMPTGQLLIDNTVSLISAGTEAMLVDFGRSKLSEAVCLGYCNLGPVRENGSRFSNRAAIKAARVLGHGTC